jgi:hypothetical protein
MGVKMQQIIKLVSIVPPDGTPGFPVDHPYIFVGFEGKGGGGNLW